MDNQKYPQTQSQLFHLFEMHFWSMTFLFKQMHRHSLATQQNIGFSTGICHPYFVFPQQKFFYFHFHSFFFSSFSLHPLILFTHLSLNIFVCQILCIHYSPCCNSFLFSPLIYEFLQTLGNNLFSLQCTHIRRFFFHLDLLYVVAFSWFFYLFFARSAVLKCSPVSQTYVTE